MLEKLKHTLGHQKIFDLRNVGLYVFLLVVLAISWSGVKTIQTNYELQREISTLKQQNAVTKLQNENISLENKYYQSNQYLELAARQGLGLAAPGEKILLIPKDVALKYVDQNLSKQTISENQDTRSKYSKNFQGWRDFLLGRKAAAN